MEEVRLKIVSNTPLVERSLCSPKDALELVYKLIHDEAQESFVVVYLNTELQALNYSVIGKGSTTKAVISPADIFKIALLNNSTRILLFHNHPGGSLKPSEDDIVVTKKIYTLGMMMGIEVIDHIICANGAMFSFQANDLLESCSIEELQLEITSAVNEFNEKYSIK